MFPNLPPFCPSDEYLIALGREEGPMEEEAQNPRGVNEQIPAGFVFFGQFIDHDITLDTTSELDKQADATASKNFRNPTLGLDNIYGSGPEASPFLYDNEEEGKFFIDTGGWYYADDLPRNSQGTALIGDPRNDENHIIAQLQLAMLKFHNAVLDMVKNGDLDCERVYEDDFEEAQRLVRWHYQWVILHEFLPLTVGKHLVDDILKNGRQVYAFEDTPFIPVEFSVAAYRFGHSQVPSIFAVNENNREVSLFGLNEVRRTDHETKEEARVDWRLFFDFPNGGNIQYTRKIDEKLAKELLALPFIEPEEGNEHRRSLAVRNLLRGKTFSLPSGQDLARAIGASNVHTPEELGLDGKNGRPELEKAPAWFYILKEADLQQGGNMLGELGGRITAEVLIGLMEGDPRSYLNMAPNWEPCLPAEEEGTFKMSDLLRNAGVVEE
jgi:hypothetical protein